MTGSLPAPAGPSVGCAQCGDCCERIPMPPYWDPHEARPVPGSDAETDIAFMREHWTRHPDHDDADLSESLWQCDRFDPQARTCTAYGDRPPVCRNYPWYRDGPTVERAGNLPSRCSLLWDVPREWRPAGARPLIPVEVLQPSRELSS